MESYGRRCLGSHEQHVGAVRLVRTLPTKRQPADGARYLHYAKRGSHLLVGPFRTSRKPLNVAFVRAQACGLDEG